MKITTSTKPKQQKSQNHSERDHALLSASGASRWINCTPSARLEEKYGEHTTSAFASEGTLAHEIAELYLRLDVLGTIDNEDFEEQIGIKTSNELFKEEMLDYVSVYTDYCEGQYNEAKTNDACAAIEIEQKLDLTGYVPESFGTADCIVIANGTLEIIDLKYGKGVPVYAEYNKQLMLYALGAIDAFSIMYDIDTVKMTIVQPRLGNISTYQMSVEELGIWADQELKPAAEKAFAGEGELSSGDWCKFCSIKNRCKALYGKMLEAAKYEFAEPELMTDDEIADVLGRATKLIEWLDSVKEYASSEALNNNKKWPGFKLVEGVSRRKWDDEEKVANAIFANFPEASDDEIYEMKLKSISAIEKLYGKKIVDEKLKSVIIKPQGKPTLVPDSDKRPALGIEDAVNDFKD